MKMFFKSMFLLFNRTKDISYCARAIKNAGFSHTFIEWGYDETRFLQVKQCEKNGLIIESAHTKYDRINSMWTEGTEGNDFTDYLITSVKEAREVGIPCLIVHLTSGDYPPPTSKIGADRFERVCEAGYKHGVDIAFENLRKTEYLDFVFENIDLPSRKFCYDCGHELLYNDGTGVLEKYADFLVTCHLHDNQGERDDHQIPFEGTMDWERLALRIARLNKAGKWNIPLTLELKQKDSRPDFAQLAFESLCKFEDRILSICNDK